MSIVAKSAPLGGTLFATFLEAVPDAIVAVDGEGSIVLVNARAETLFGYEREELIGLPVELLVPSSVRDHSQLRIAYFRDPVSRPMGAGMELAGRRKDGSEFPAEVSLSTIETEEGLMVCAAIRDVTERVEAQRERARLETQLERDRLERQVHQSQRLESLGQLAGGVAHDFNNLLAAILNYVTFVSEEITKEIELRPPGEAVRLHDVLSDVSQIAAAAQRAARLTHQLLAFGRREVIKPEIIDFNAVVGAVDDLLRRTIGEHVELITRCALNLEHVRADRGQMEQVLLNLAVNARDAMPGGGTLIVDTDNVTVDEAQAAKDPRVPAGRYVRLRVADSGTGMSPEIIERAFEPFFSTKPKEQGTGLGLATVYGIVTQAGGMVELSSGVGTGTTITILLPSISSSVTVAGVPRVLTRRRHGGETILVVEDEELVLDVASRILSRNGYHVLAANGGAQALELIRTHRGIIHLLLTDVVMPGITGNEVAGMITKVRPKMRVLYMSGYPESVITSQGVVQAGMRLVSKPFVAADLLELVRATLDA